MTDAPAQHGLYGALASWWPLLSPPETYEAEGAVYAALLSQAAVGPVRTVLELGSGGGNLAANLPDAWDVTLLDASEAMLDVSRRLNPDRAHVVGDLRTARLGRTFDAVVLHDAVMYLLSPADLDAAVATIAAHLRPGGACLVVPDVTEDTFFETTMEDGADDEDRAARLIEWRWDPDPSDGVFLTELVLLLREHGRVRVVHETHPMGLFSREQVADALAAHDLGLVPPDLPPGIELGEVFLARRG